MAIIAATPRLLLMYADINRKMFVSGGVQAPPFSFTDGDEYKGTLYIQDASGNWYTPIVDSNAVIALTDGLSLHYADAASLAYVPGTSTVPPSITFNLVVAGAALTSALAALPSINAFMEVRLLMAGTTAQKLVIVADQARIRNTALYPTSSALKEKENGSSAPKARAGRQLDT